MSTADSTYVWTRRRKITGASLILLVVALFTVPFVHFMRTETRAEGLRLPPSAGFGFNMDNLVIASESIESGGVRKDGIPSLTDPPTVPVAEAGFLDPKTRVIGVVAGGQWRAYPIAVLNWHEAINDTLGGVPVGVIYCPLCDSASVVDRRIDGKTLWFGISGLLANSNVLLYDRTDQALWSQVGLTAVSGPYAGKSLKHLDQWELATFADFAKRHPEATVVTFETGHKRDYQRNPYQSYFASDQLMFPIKVSDDRVAPKAPVVGVRFADVARAYPIDRLRKAAADAPQPAGVVTDSIAGKTIKLSVDAQTGSVRIVDLPEGAQVVYTFWFAWAAFHPETQLFGQDP